jgi:hypothetical protein
VDVQPVLRKLRDALEAVGIPYFVSGSFASSAHGIPRSTNDIDIVIAPPSARTIEELLTHFPPETFATYPDDAFDALARKSSFNVIDYATMWKVDFLIKQPTPFDASRFARRRIMTIAGVPVYTSSAEDILLTKLWWAKLGESQRQITDAAGIVKVQGPGLDLDYIERWVAALELEQQWLAARRSGPLTQRLRLAAAAGRVGWPPCCAPVVQMRNA